jgi:peptide/nickel transport system permease protein
VPHSERRVHLDESLSAPSAVHLCGTDLLGRDVLARLLHGTRASVAIGFGATLLALLLGLLLGGAAALWPGAADLVLGRVIEILGCFPPLLLALALVAAAGQRGLLPILLAIAAGRTASAARFVRAETMRLQAAPFWLAARAGGAPPWQAARRHLLPLIAAPLLVQAAFGVSQAILIESGLGFLGLGVEPPVPSWGQMIGEGRGVASGAWWTVAFPAAALALTLLVLLQREPESVVNDSAG